MSYLSGGGKLGMLVELVLVAQANHVVGSGSGGHARVTINLVGDTQLQALRKP